MNILIDDLPKEIDGVPIETDYRKMIQFEQLMFDEEISIQQKYVYALNLLYLKPVPDFIKAWRGLLWFFRCGNENKEASSSTTQGKLVYDFEQDAEYIYSAFWQVYRIDLQKEPLHWWAFMSLLSALPDSCLMGQIMQYRSMDTSKLKGLEKKRVQEIQRKFAIRHQEGIHKMTLEERNGAFLAKVKQRQKEANEWLKKQAKEGFNGR